MNYRHAFHAGNFADVFKHVFLTRILTYLLRKETPVYFLDTHAGRGDYDLGGDQAARTQEWRGGVGRLDAAAMPGNVRDLLQPYLALAAPGDGPGDSIYPGSPILAQQLLRPHDRLRLNELHPDDADALEHALGRDRRARVSRIDGYSALRACVPPRERRGMVLIDPSFEAADEWARMEQALRQAHRKWGTGIFALWYPVKDPAASDAVTARFRNATIDKVLRLELLLETAPRRGTHAALALIGCGLLIVNPPYVLEDEAAVLLPYLARVLAPDAQGSWRIERLADAREAAPAERRAVKPPS